MLLVESVEYDSSLVPMPAEAAILEVGVAPAPPPLKIWESSDFTSLPLESLPI